MLVTGSGQSYQVKNIDCAYGRQAVIPQIGSSQLMSQQPHADATAVSDAKGKQHVDVGLLPGPTSCSAGAASKDGSAVLIADTTEKSSTHVHTWLLFRFLLFSLHTLLMFFGINMVGSRCNSTSTFISN